MIKCQNCGSTAQFMEYDTEYHENGDTIIVERSYQCGCGYRARTLQTYRASDLEEEDE